jgi:hypothetical protein
MTAFADPMVHDELMGVVSTLSARFQNRSRDEIEGVVAKVHAELAKNATVTPDSADSQPKPTSVVATRH